MQALPRWIDQASNTLGASLCAFTAIEHQQINMDGLRKHSHIISMSNQHSTSPAPHNPATIPAYALKTSPTHGQLQTTQSRPSSVCPRHGQLHVLGTDIDNCMHVGATASGTAPTHVSKPASPPHQARDPNPLYITNDIGSLLCHVSCVMCRACLRIS
jgi:hypothetical protein